MSLILARVALAGFAPAVPHVTTDPLMPQKYRLVPQGKYPCSVEVDVSAEGKVTDVRNVACDADAFWTLATAVVQWRWDPATQDGAPVASTFPYTNVFEVRTLLPRKHVVGYAGLAVSGGGAGLVGAEGRVHLGEQLSVSAGVDLDQDAYERTSDPLWVPTVRADFALSSRRQHFERRGIYGIAVGGFADGIGATGMYGAFRGEVMTGVPGLALGGDAGLATLFTDPPTYDDVGPWLRAGVSPVYPWLRASVIWYAPIPRDRFVVVPRAQDPVLFEPEPPPPEEPLPDPDGQAFPGVPARHWSEVDTASGGNTPTGPGFASYPPGTYTCNIRIVVGEDGSPQQARVEKCPEAARQDALENAKGWRWPPRPGAGPVQAVFPAPVFVERDDADLVDAVSVMPIVDGAPKPLPRRVEPPLVYVHRYVSPDWGMTLPTRDCYVDVDLDVTGKRVSTRWMSGDIEVKPRVEEALAQWTFYPVAVDGELAPVRVRLSMCED